MDIRKARDELYRGISIFMMCLRVTFYARVSTDKMEQAGSLENQVQYFTEFIERHTNWTLVPGYVDEGISGISTDKRDSFNRMIADARAGKFDFIITKEISRFSRNTLDSIQYTQELLRLGVAVLFQSDNLNTLDTDSEFRLTVMAGVAQDEVRKLSERLKFGFRQSIKNGRVLGNDKLYGYDKRDCVLTINETEARIVRMIFELYVHEQLGMRKISFRLLEHGITSSRGNAFNTTTIKNILLNPKYKGWYCANKSKSLDYKTKRSAKLDKSEWICYPDESIPAIVSEDLWERANAQLQQRGEAFKQSGAVSSGRYAYSGKLVCAEHGTSFHRQKSTQHETWQCKVYRTQGVAACSLPQLRTSELDGILADIFNELYADKSGFIAKTLALIQSAEPPRDDHAKELAQLRRKKEKLLELSLDDIITKQEFRQRNEELNQQIAALEHIPSPQTDLGEIKAFLEAQFSPVHSNIAASILDKIVVHNTGDRQSTKLDIYLKTGGQNTAFVCHNRSRNTTPTPSSKTT
ncbi:MAG: recombinase family protein [Oscillospiraceae bacterium]|nr:recombinase family protein [Oscillospiraceae bacterium]